MRRAFVVIGALLLPALAACDGTSGGAGDMAGGGGADQAQAMNGKDGGPGGSDGGGGGGTDMAGAAADMASAMPRLRVEWQLINKNKQGEPMNGFFVNCDDVGVTQLAFTVFNPMTKNMKATTVDCRAGQKIGEAMVDAPDAMGPFEICGKAVGKSMSTSDRVANVMADRGAAVRVYVDGCNFQNCCM